MTRSFRNLLLNASVGLVLLSPTLADAQAACSSNGIDLTTTDGQVLNTYYPNPLATIILPAGSTSIQVDTPQGAGPITAGDLILITQVQGAPIDTRSQAAVNNPYGDGPGLADRQGAIVGTQFTAGTYEWNIADGPVAGGVVPLRFPTATDFTAALTINGVGPNQSIGFRRYQVVRVPLFRDLTVPAGTMLTGLAWDGRSGGIVAVDVSRDFNLLGTIDGTGLGFRGGSPVIPCSAAAPQCDNAQLGRKGEGISGTGNRVYNRVNGFIAGLPNGIPSGNTNRGGPGNAGGTPQGNNDSGGGGGGGGGPGGTGAIGPGAGSANTEPRGGLGYQDVTRLFMGGGGGSGSLDDFTSREAVSGQAGGAIVYLRFTNVTGTGTIRSNGDGGATQPQEGGGGGGGGGTIFIRTEVTDLSLLTIEARGGDGASTVMSNDGAGGGGGGGFVVIANPTGMVVATPDVMGGAGGVGGGGSGTSGNGGFQQLTAPPINSNCPGPDTDQDNFNDFYDLDDDNDGILDSDETGGLFAALDPSGDRDDDGVPNYLDLDFWTGIGMAAQCIDVMLPAGECDETPMVIDVDGDGIPNHLDRDSDGDGITDVFESGGVDTTGTGVPDACIGVDNFGRCLDAGGGSLILMAPFPDTDTTGGPNYLDPDSDGDGIGDAVESNDVDGNGMLNGAETVPLGTDVDNDGIDDAYDPDVAGSDPLLPPFAAGSTEDSNGDGIPDWLQICGDAYVTGAEACDDGNTNDAGDACSNMCLRNDGQPCTLTAQCVNLCDPGTLICESCIDDVMGGGADTGCAAPAAHCETSGVRNTCEPCVDTGAGMDDGCSGATIVCDVSLAPNTCVPCLDTGTGVMTDDGCPAGMPLCDTTPAGGSPTNVCQVCLDDVALGTDVGCMGINNVCDASTATNMCVDCLDSGTIPDNGCMVGATVCVGGGGAQMCMPCFDSDPGAGTDEGCVAATPFCEVPAGGGVVSCRECRTTADCPGGEFCNPSGVCTPGCTMNSDCSVPTPACDGTTMTCVECTMDSDCSGAAPTCDTLNNVCVPCTEAVGLPDNGCTDPTLPVCEGTSGVGTAGIGCVECTLNTHCSGATPACEPMTNTCVECTMNSDCPGTAPSCDVMNNICVVCVDSPGLPDDGCSDPTLPVCAGTTGPGTVGTMCVECLQTSDCGAGMVCNPTAMTCEVCFDSGTDPDTGCVMPLSICDESVADGMCVECLVDTDCTMGSCNPTTNRCGGPPDFDMDGEPDETDIDDDNDGITDVVEGGGVDFSLDTDGDGNPDYADPDSVTCDDTDSDGVCDTLNVRVDLDQDGIPNHFDLDADGDGVPDTIEGHDANMDGVADTPPPGSFIDTDMDGLADAYDPDDGGTAAAVQDTDNDGEPDFLDVDDDGDTVLTRFEAPDPNGDGDPTDAQDTDGDGTPDWLDIDDDGDTVLTRFEAPDPDDNGNPNDARDTDNDGDPDYLDIDDDGDTVLTRFEAPDPDGNGDPSDARDTDGSDGPDYLDIDDDGDMINTEDETPDMNGDGNPDDALDTDGNGTPDWLQPAGGGGVIGGLSGGALCSAQPGRTPSWPLGLVFAAVLGWIVRRRFGR